MLNKIATSLMITAMMALGTGVRADESTSGSVKNTVMHPEQTYHEHEVKEDAQDSQMYNQQRAEAKARLDQAKMDYEKSLQSNGADNDVTKQAKKRFADARKEYKKYAKKTEKANKELQEDKQELEKDKATQ